jgi:superfamily II DNA or RNA helicase
MDLEAIVSRPDLVNELRREDWRGFFSKGTLKRARSYTQPNRLLELKAIPEGFAINVAASFHGNYQSNYRTTLQFANGHGRQWSYGAHCSCPVGHGCKHIAAAFIAITNALNNPRSTPQKPRISDPGDLSVWLSSVSDALAPPAPVEEKKKAPAANFLAYCLKPPAFSHESCFTLSLHVGRKLKSGDFRITLGSQATADPISPPAYMTPEDTMPSTLFHQLQRSSYRYGGIRMVGPQAALLLKQALETGRLFYVKDRDHFQLLTPGESILPEPIWENRPDGSARPTFAPPFSEALGIINTQPPHIILPHEGGEHLTLNPLDLSKHSAVFLKAWSAGPTLKPEQVATAANALQTSLPTLPKPVPVETKTLKKSKPAIHLHLHRANPFTHGGLHLSGQPEPIIGELTFRYHGHSFIPDLAEKPEGKASFIASKKGTVFTIPRDTDFERNTIFHLVEEYDIVPAGVHDSAVAPDHRSAFLPEGPASQWDMATAQFITQDIPTLREQGWHITIDTTAEVEVHTIGPDELDTGLTELPDHGIDWFQFSASYLTPAGDKQPLLPLLSSYLKYLDFDTIDQTLEILTDDDQTLLKDPEEPNSFLALPTKRLLLLAKTLYDLFGTNSTDEPLHRLQAAALANVLEMDGTQTLKDLAALGNNLKNVTTLPRPKPPKSLEADLRDYQLDGFHWMQFLARHGLHGILADDMGLGKTLQALTHLQAEVSGRRTGKLPTLVLAPTSVVGNWKAEAKKFTPKLKTLLLHGPDRRDEFKNIPKVQLVITSYALLVRDFDDLKEQDFHLVILDEAQYIKNPAAKVSQLVCRLRTKHRISLSGTPLENHLGELWSQMRFLMPGLLGSSEAFNKHFRTPIEKHGDSSAQISLNSRVAPLILRRTKDQVATELPPKTEILHTIPLNPGQIDIYETVRAAMDDRIRDAIADKGLAKSQIIVLDALLKLRQICCHPQLLKLPAAQKVKHSAKLDFLTEDLLPTLLDEGRKILIFSTFTTMLALIQKHLEKKKITFSKITGSTKDRQKEIEKFQNGDTPVFLISLKAGGTGLNLTAADTVIHYDPWWNPAAENQATDRAHRIGQDKPVFVHKLITEGSIEERIVQLQAQKAKLVEALLSEKTTRLQLDQETLGNLLAPLE